MFVCNLCISVCCLGCVFYVCCVGCAFYDVVYFTHCMCGCFAFVYVVYATYGVFCVFCALCVLSIVYFEY